MNLAKIIVLLFACWGINSCQDPCKLETPPEPPCIDKAYGDIPLNESLYFLNHPKDSNDFELINEKGTVLTIKNVFDTSTFNQRFYKSYSKNPDKCNYVVTCFNTANTNYEYNRYEGVELPYQLSLIRHNTNINSIDSFIASRSWRFMDNAAIGINYTFIDLPFNNSKISTYKYFDTITLNKKLYNQVYHVWIDSNHVNYRTDIFPRGAYYNFEKGILGFYFSDNETWLRK